MVFKRNILLMVVVMFSSQFVLAGVKKSDCRLIDWQAKGYEDGIKGEKINKLYKYIKTCDSVQSPFSADEYRTGRNEGLEIYCSNRNAYKLGQENKVKAKKVCIEKVFPDFALYYEKGRSFVKLSKEQEKVSKRIKKYEKYISKLEEAQTDLTNLSIEVEEVEFKADMEETNVNRSAAFMKLKSREKFVIENDMAKPLEQTEVGSLRLGTEESFFDKELEGEEEVESSTESESKKESLDLEEIEVDFSKESVELI